MTLAPLLQGQGRSLTDIPAAEIVSLLREHGAVVLREFPIDDQAFRALAEQIGCDFYNMSLDPRIRDTVSSDGVVAGVLKGADALPLHMERGYSPLKPELVMFHVIQPAAIGGESLLCHGERVLKELAPEVTARFRSKRLKYRHTWEPSAWRGRYGNTQGQVTELLCQRDGVSDVRFEGDLLHYTYVVSAIVRSRLGGGDSFANNVEGAWEVQHAPEATRRAVHEHSISFEDDEPLRPDLVAHVHEAVERSTEVYPQQPMDVIILDNYRVMHGRRSFEGPRLMHTIMADANF